MNGLIAAGAVVAAVGTVWALWRAVSVAGADRKRARAEHGVRRRQHQILLLAGVGVVVIAGLVAVGGLGGLPTLGTAASASPGPSASPCSDRNTGTLTLVRSTPTTITWTYAARGESAGGSVRLYVRVAGRDAGPGPAREPTGTVTDVPAHPVAVHVEGIGPGGQRVYATCTG